MRRKYEVHVSLSLVLADPLRLDEDSIRALTDRFIEYTRREADDFPWPMDVFVSLNEERVTVEEG